MTFSLALPLTYGQRVTNVQTRFTDTFIMTTETDLIRIAIENADPFEVAPSFLHTIIFADDDSGDGIASKLLGFSTGEGLTRGTVEDIFPQVFNEYVLARARDGVSLEGRQMAIIIADLSLDNARLIAQVLIQEAQEAGATPFPVLITDRASWSEVVEGASGHL